MTWPSPKAKSTKTKSPSWKRSRFDDNDIRIEYTGKVNGDEIKLHRKVGDFAEEDLVAKRVKQATLSSNVQRAETAGTNLPPAKP